MRDLPPRARTARGYRIFVDHGRRRKDDLLIRLLSPCYEALVFVLRGAWRILFGWWLDPLSQRRKNRALWSDVEANLYFLYSEGEPIVEKRPVSLPFDYASVRILVGNVYYCFTRGRGELNVTLAPRHSPTHFHELSLVIAALDSAKLRPIGDDFASVSSAIGPRIAALDQAFSQNQYSEFERKLP